MNPLLKNPVLRKIYRFFVPLTSADVLMDQFCAGFEATAAEQELLEKEADAKAKAAQKRAAAARKEKNRAQLASKNIKNMLTKEED